MPPLVLEQSDMSRVVFIVGRVYVSVPSHDTRLDSVAMLVSRSLRGHAELAPKHALLSNTHVVNAISSFLANSSGPCWCSSLIVHGKASTRHTPRASERGVRTQQTYNSSTKTEKSTSSSR